MPPKKKRLKKSLGNCRYCGAELFHTRTVQTQEVRETPRYQDGTPKLFAELHDEKGDLLHRVFTVDEVCENGHRASWERTVSRDPQYISETPMVLSQMPMIFTEEDGWMFDIRALMRESL